MTERDLEALLDRTIGSIWRDLRVAFDALRASLGVDGLARLIATGNARAAAESVRLEALGNAMARLQSQLVPVREASWQVVAEGLPRSMQSDPLLRVTLGAHALQEPTVLDAIRRADLSRIQGITRETQEAIRQVLERGIREGVNPNVLAKQLRSVVGLTTRQAGDVARFRDRLVKEGRTPDQVERMTAKYAARRLAERTRTIAVTEVSRAQNEARQAQTERLVATGKLIPGEWEQEWVTAADERTCPVCMPMHGVRVPLLALWPTPIGPVLYPPLHPNCRCITRLAPKGFRQGESPSPARDAILARLGTGPRR